MPVILSCRELSKSFGVHALFEGLSMGIDEGSRVGLIGPNGSGKSTLLRIFAGSEQPDEGERAVASGTRMVYLPQRDEFAEPDPEAVIVAALVGSHPQWEDHQRDAHARAMLGRAGFGEGDGPAIDQSVATLSGGWRKRLAITRALAQEPDLLLMDEPTNHLDLEGIWWLEALLSDARFTYVVVSHDRFFLERACDRVIELNRMYPGGHFAVAGGYSTFLEKRAEFAANQKSRQESLDNRARREIEWLRSNPAAQMKKSRARIKDAGSLLSDLSALKSRNSAQDRRVDIDFSGTGRRTNDLVVVDGVGKTLGDRALFTNVELTLSPGTRLGLLGLNGSGKTTFLKVLAGQLPPDVGKIKHATGLKVVIFDQKREQLDQKQTLRLALCPTGQTVIYRGRGIHIASWAKRFLFDPQQLDLEVSKLSGGEQARVLIANLVRRDADLLILDEPTNDLDIPSLEVLEDSLIDFPGAVVLVTHDRYLLDRVSTTLLALDGSGGSWTVADCSQWEDLAGRIRAERERAAGGETAKPAPALPKAATARGLSPKEQGELRRIGERMKQAEKKIEDLSAKAADPRVAADPDALHAACAALAKAQAELDGLVARWEDLEARAG